MFSSRHFLPRKTQPSWRRANIIAPRNSKRFEFANKSFRPAGSQGLSRKWRKIGEILQRSECLQCNKVDFSG
jgi:hypothetical protein